MNNDVFNLETAYAILEKNDGFQTMGWNGIDEAEKNKRAFCKFLELLPNELRLRILKHASHFEDSVVISLDSGELYSVYQQYPSLVVSKSLPQKAKRVYMNIMTTRDPDAVHQELQKTDFPYEDVLWSIEKGEIESRW